MTLSSRSSPYTHFNFRTILPKTGAFQDEFPPGRPVVKLWHGQTRPFRFSVQVCNRGGALQRSSCRPWASFVHRF